ncbi:hypothetical protein [Mycolicibacterium fortuitum]|uniref:YbaB/EbfC family DNA-binding protein n=2 Tax=Mycolicibacterium fortuitum TaxID=1766 RepID=A0AAE4VK28_MYCFO|nr:hypothetical protein [Mycolicibacterium fortuitum]MCV7144256.1 hypothetical protein [Mycolicibacterium fortuitum]MDV7195354.1 hypothetical protein [Mycolicibacterium fortuitum]MDV7209061.1 hypothetical protein [Mycolicibacterium fortuitum]MDV7230897.1 hypothetical protein [Mycolicibacterium fortuitum]MDV7262468.1 hypothetical protein [Mycolicibacterium fortuitum]
MAVIHPDVKNTLHYADTVYDHLLKHIEKIKALAAERISEDRDIAVKVDMKGQLVDLWLKPGILDRKTAAEIAKEITRLVTAAGQETAEQIAELVRAAHEYPDFDTVVAEQENSTAAEPETALQPR